MNSDMLVVQPGTPHPDPCPEPGCGAPLRLIIAGKRPFYGCSRYPACNGAASAHSDGRPIGHAAPMQLRVQRSLAHLLFTKVQDHLGMYGKDKRTKVYELIGEHMEKDPGEDGTHFGTMDEDEIKDAIKTMNLILKGKIPV